jgi:excisionase family DNA binding protein
VLARASPYLTVAQVADVLGMSPSGVHKLIQRGKLPALRLSERGTRVARWALDAYVDALNGRGPDTSLPSDAFDPVRLRTRFEDDSGMTPEAWIAAWKRGKIEDSPEGSTRLVRALALRQRQDTPPALARDHPWAVAAFVDPG